MSSTQISRVFLGWDRPALPAAADVLLDGHAGGGPADLAEVLVIVPGSRAGRRLLEILLQKSRGRLSPPRIETVSRLPELLYEPKLPFAGDLTQRLAWIEALGRQPAEDLAQLVRTPPAPDDLTGWLGLAELLQTHHRELAAHNLNFADAIKAGADVHGDEERSRWDVIARLQRDYLGILDGLQLWDRQTARLEAVRRRECRAPGHIYLVGTSDLEAIFCRMLDQIADQVTALVAAPAEWAHRFDAYGRVLPDQWDHAEIPLDSERIVIVDRPDEQAEQVARTLSEFGGRYRADQITIGMPDESLVPRVRRLLQECGVATRWFVARTLGDALPCRLLAAAAEFVQQRSAAAFAALARHPDVSAWLLRRGVADDWLTRLDTYIREQVPTEFPTPGLREESRWYPLRRAVEQVEHLLSDFDAARRPLTEWGERIARFLSRVYADVEFDRSLPEHDAVLTAAEGIQNVIAAQAEIPASLIPEVTAAAAIKLVLRELGDDPLPAPVDPAAVELLGWLELPLDDAPALVVTNVNEGFVPASVNGDPFLPDRLRSRMGIVDNARRYARDAYAMSLILNTRDTVVLIAGRRDQRGDPLVPSRLLLAADAETIARRIRDFYRPPSTGGRPPLAGVLRARRERAGFTVPRPRQPEKPLRSLRVTAFRDYLESPYRFYLRHVERLCDLDDRADELDAGSFGTLAHHVLAEFGGGEAKDLADPREIERTLNAILDAAVRRAWGTRRAVAVDVQVEQLRTRLRSFARWQAEHVAAGWRIQHVELQCESEGFKLDDGRSISLRGTIDRIDRHPGTGQWALFDYKTSESAKGPDRTHRRKEEWIDLQLPLYRLLAEEHGVSGDARLGYIVVAPDAATVKAEFADWSAADLADAERKAREIARLILDGEFWKELPQAPRALGEFGPICQDGVFQREAVV